MSAGKIIAYIVAAILIFFGVLFIWSAFSPEGNPGNIITGGISAAIGLGLIWLAGRKKASDEQEVTMNIDLSGDVNLETMKCKSCGGTLTSENITLVAGAPMVECPYCGTEYQLTEEPKW
ncbi:MAG: hypothetical protein B5M51_07885 [Anaerolinea sp. 4484_236]|nr:MAG: hypothetical protein B5M51_07885 [Anaerolinea sp. 4484_236]RLD06223.1 MAG: hypothetical protein DRI56_08375 [Chloroflexota bacterium]